MYKNNREIIYILSNYTNAYISNEGLSKLKEIAKNYSTYTKKTATIGIDSTVKNCYLKVIFFLQAIKA
ncbi:MAG: hypothetical protein HQK51_13180 [Oligoflexia bacterium]|nr:hypothetical protein [Oligoflexia bacterium]